MRFRNLLGLLAIGGAVAYAQKKRNGDLSLEGFKNTFRELGNKVKDKLGTARTGSPIASTSRNSSASTTSSDLGSTSDDDYASTSSGFSRDVGGSPFNSGGSTRR